MTASVANVKVIVMDSSKIPLEIQVAKHDQWETKQPRVGADVVPSVPCRIVLSSPSGSGKTVLLVDMLTRIYAGCFERIYVFSPSIHLDSLWSVVKDYSSKVLGVPPEEETFFDSWDEAKLSEILSTQKAVVQHQKEEKVSNKIYSICVVVDDFADDQRVMASRSGSGGSAINMLLTRGRHIFCSCMLSSQKYKCIGSIARINSQALVVFRLRNKMELDCIIEEVSNYYDKKILLEMYTIATSEPYSFWYINLAASRLDDVFWLRFEQRMIPSTPMTPPSNALAV